MNIYGNIVIYAVATITSMLMLVGMGISSRTDKHFVDNRAMTMWFVTIALLFSTLGLAYWVSAASEVLLHKVNLLTGT